MHPSLRPLAPLAALLCALAFGPPALAADPVFVEAAPDGERVALRGFDAVAYHRLGAPVLGSTEFALDWNGAVWRFMSAANRDAFAREPARYAPQYGGYCAFGTSRGYKVSTQPDQFAVIDSKLYLNYNAAVSATWNKDRGRYIGIADANWPSLVEEAYESDEASVARVKREKAEAGSKRAASGGR